MSLSVLTKWGNVLGDPGTSNRSHNYKSCKYCGSPARPGKNDSCMSCGAIREFDRSPTPSISNSDHMATMFE
jgi:hypothetical protein